MAFENLKRKLEKGENITLGYLGGSITQGAGVEDKSLCWRSLTTEWFRKKYPKNEFCEINAGIGGTGTDLGMFRAKKDLLSGKPDVVFVEFAVNDHRAGFKMAQYCMESIVRQILEADEKTDIVFVITIAKFMQDDFKEGKRLESYEAHYSVAEHYGIECIDVGTEFISRIDKGEGDWKTYTTDYTHPNEYGYKLYFEKVTKEIERLMENGKSVVFAKPMHKDSFVHAEMIDACTLNGNFEKTSENLCGHFPTTAKAYGKGEYLEYEGDFDCVALYYRNCNTSGDIAVSIDGKDYGNIRLWDTYALEFERAHHRMIAFELESGRHNIRITSSGEKDERAQAGNAYIGALLTARRF